MPELITAEPHPPNGPGWAGVDNCYIHGYEPWPERFYMQCFECGHVYATPDDLRGAYRRAIEHIAAVYLQERNSGRQFHDGLHAEIDPLVVPPAENIPFCQECLHDF
jgi:hypothetical protein